MIEEIRRLKEERLIRQISPIYDTKMAGYDSSLVAFRVPEGRLEEVARLINLHPGVSHNYKREHEFNLWFTIAVPPDGRLSLEETVSIMADLGRVEEYLILRTVKTYKIGVKLDYKDLTEREEVKPHDRREPPKLTALERLVVRETRETFPLSPDPSEFWRRG